MQGKLEAVKGKLDSAVSRRRTLESDMAGTETGLGLDALMPWFRSGSGGVLGVTVTSSHASSCCKTLGEVESSCWKMLRCSLCDGWYGTVGVIKGAGTGGRVWVFGVVGACVVLQWVNGERQAGAGGLEWVGVFMASGKR